ncbi:MAG TPA: acyl carrier protein [Gemmataceae bacterium]|nr:acyl carrier protein [Gemmataceae bacterium]
MHTPNAIHTKVQQVLMQALNVEPEEVTPAARLRDDLGAESIDFLDIVFRLEREFGLRIPRAELFPESVFGGDPAFVRDGVVTDEGMLELRARMPFADLSRLESDRRLNEVPALFTVDLLDRYIAWKLNGSPDQGNGTDTPDHGVRAPVHVPQP